MKRNILFSCALFSFILLHAQFHPPAGYSGTSAIHKDSSVFVAWANSCSIIRGYQNIALPDSGFASVGDSSSAIGTAGINGIVSLGDGGVAILQFQTPIYDGPGYDFAVFENSFSDNYLELAFVEVSSDGINFFRFPSSSLTQDSIQCGPFGLTDATKIHNLAGKYRMHYGTPFELNELSGIQGLNINAVTHVRIMDVVGSIDSNFASYDKHGNRINDPWPTMFPSSGFDLDAVGVIHQQNNIGFSEFVSVQNDFKIFQSDESINIKISEQDLIQKIVIYELNGNILHEFNDINDFNFQFKTTLLNNGFYLLRVFSHSGRGYHRKFYSKN